MLPHLGMTSSPDTQVETFMWNIYHKPTGEFEHCFSLLCTKKQFKRILTLINCFNHQKLIFGVPMKSSDYFCRVVPSVVLLGNHDSLIV
jgi:hypothetical protein